MIWNKSTLNQHDLYQKSYHSLDLLAPYRYKSDLSIEVLYILVSQEAAKISEVKVGGRKKSARAARPRTHRSRIWPSWQFLIDLQLWPLIFFQPLDQQECTVPYLKDLINIYLQNESQGHDMTFNMIYLHSKYPVVLCLKSPITPWSCSLPTLKGSFAGWEDMYQRFRIIFLELQCSQLLF